MYGCNARIVATVLRSFSFIGGRLLQEDFLIYDVQVVIYTYLLLLFILIAQFVFKLPITWHFLDQLSIYILSMHYVTTTLPDFEKKPIFDKVQIPNE